MWLTGQRGLRAVLRYLLLTFAFAVVLVSLARMAVRMLLLSRTRRSVPSELWSRIR